MKRIVTAIITVVTCLSFSASAAQKSAARVKKQKFTPLQFDYIKTQAFRNAFMQNIVNQMNLVDTAKDFDERILSFFPTKERTKIRAMLKLTGNKMTTAENQDGVLVATSGTAKLRVEWPDISKTEFKINGVLWVYNPAKSLSDQLGILAQKLKPRETALHDLLLPRAEALIPAVAAAMAAHPYLSAAVVAVGTHIGSELLKNFGGGILTAGNDVFCTQVDKAGGVGIVGICSEWKKNEEEKVLAGMPALDAITQQVASSGAGNVLDKWEAQEWVCPDNNDGKDRIYQARIRRIVIKDGKKEPQGAWSNIRAVIGADTKPKSLMVGPIDVDLENASNDDATMNKIYMSVSFEKTKGRMTEIAIPNPEWKPDTLNPIVGPTIKITPALRLSVPEAEKLTRGKDLVAFVNQKVMKCVVRNLEMTSEQAGTPGQPAAPAEPAPAAAPAGGTAQ